MSALTHTFPTTVRPVPLARNTTAGRYVIALLTQSVRAMRPDHVTLYTGLSEPRALTLMATLADEGVVHLGQDGRWRLV